MLHVKTAPIDVKPASAERFDPSSRGPGPTTNSLALNTLTPRRGQALHQKFQAFKGQV